MKKLILYILLSIGFMPMVLAHDLHLSVLEVEVEEDKVRIILKTFLDDLQIAVGLEPGAPIPEDYTSADEMIKEYIHQTISCSLGELHVERIDASPTAVWIELSISIDELPTAVSIDNSFLTEVYKDQTNLIKIKKGGKTKAYTLDRKKTSIAHQFK